MADRKTHVANFFETELTTELGPTDLVAEVLSTGGLQSPAILVIEPDNPNQREVILFDGAFTDTQFRATSVASRYLGGSAQPGGLTHPAGSVVRSAPLAQHIQDLNDRIDADRLRITSLEEATVDTAKLADGAVTTPKLADGAVTPPKIAEGFYPPTGTVLPYAGAAAPAGWLLCDGREVSRTQYARLFEVIGTTFGAGNGSTTFNLPDFRGRLPMGAESGAGVGTRQGSAEATLAVANLPSHSHGAGSLATSSAGSHTHGAGDLSASSAGSHSHSLGSHSHTAGSLSVSGGSHSHPVPGRAAPGSIDAHGHPLTGRLAGASGASGSDFTVSTSSGGSHSHSFSGNTGSTNLGNSGSGGSHTHDVAGSTGSGGSHSHSLSGSTAAVGSGQPFSILPPVVRVNFIIKT